VGEKDILDKKPYKGTRDFYPHDMRIKNWIFNTLQIIAESYGYEPYDGPMLEAFDLYAAKTGEEIVNNQLYSFTDKGGRKVAIRPEMTPTLARMVAVKQRELPKPIRLYSIPNLWRYEQPGRGRLREHWQFNVDVLGPDTRFSEIEIFLLAADLLNAFNPPPKSYKILISHRDILDAFINQKLSLEPKKAAAFAKILDKRAKLKDGEFDSILRDEFSFDNEKKAEVHQFLNSDIKKMETIFPENPGVLRVKEILEELEKLEYSEIYFQPSIVRGMDYYSGTIFEIYDNHPSNNRSLFGGGRYDNLVSLFGGEKISGFGFGMGDVTIQNFLQTYNLLPSLKKDARIYIVLFSDDLYLETMKISNLLRKNGIPAEISLNTDKLTKQFKTAANKGMDFVIVPGPDDLKVKKVVVKNMNKGTQEDVLNGRYQYWYNQE
jgi:histidyl-tRNA synthetase